MKEAERLGESIRNECEKSIIRITTMAGFNQHAQLLDVDIVYMCIQRFYLNILL